MEIYLDTCFLTAWVKRALENEDLESLGSVKFLNETPEIVSFISSLTGAETIRTVLHGKEFKDHVKNFRIDSQYIIDLINDIQNTAKFEYIRGIFPDANQKNGKPLEIKGKKIFLDRLILTKQLPKYLEICSHLIDCIHVDIAMQNGLIFVTNERKLGKLKTLIPDEKKIMTFKKLRKQFIKGN